MTRKEWIIRAAYLLICSNSLIILNWMNQNKKKINKMKTNKPKKGQKVYSRFINEQLKIKWWGWMILINGKSGYIGNDK